MRDSSDWSDEVIPGSPKRGQRGHPLSDRLSGSIEPDQPQLLDAILWKVEFETSKDSTFGLPSTTFDSALSTCG